MYDYLLKVLNQKICLRILEYRIAIIKESMHF